MKITRAAGAAVLASLLAFSVSACGDGDKSPSEVVSNATEKAGEATKKAGEIGEKAKEAYASASASASAKLKEVKDGMDAASEVSVGEVKTDEDRSAAEVKAVNKQDKQQSYVVQVNFRDDGGNLLDTVVVTVKDVPAGKEGTAVARSNRALKGGVKAEVSKALRH
ncbi:hypothetical protein ACFYVL_32445 [Streptomyces sp. NPDC004111]|uniref:hypothetical protein n=1 Tax=Streptomyces sp. NPDC004111 TaxID=3364690 RepID=UPI00369BE39E